MIYLKKAILNIKVHRNKSILTSIICMLMILLFHLYLANISSNQRQSKTLVEEMPIPAKIVNLNGSQEVNLAIKDELIQKLQISPYVDREIFTVRTKGSIGDFAPEDWVKHLKLWVLSANNLQAIVDLDDKNITWAEGENAGFLQGVEEKCIIDQELMQDNHWNLGDTIPLYQYNYRYGKGSEIFLDPLDTTSFKIIGYVQFPVTANYTPDILIPYQTERNIFIKNEVPFFADSVSFYLADPLELNDFKKEMKKLQLLPVSRAAKFSHDGNSLSVRDSTFIVAASQLRQSMDILVGFSAFILVIAIGIGYIASFLLLQGRKEEIAIMRSLGISNKKCFIIMLIEQFIIATVGIAFGSIFAFIGVLTEIRMIALGVALVFGCYMAGASVALWRIGKISVIDALTRMD